MAISAPDIATIRRRTSATEDELPDDAISAIYASTSLGNSDLALTTYYVLEELLGVLANLVDQSGEVDSLSISKSQRWDHIEKLLAYWGGKTGLAGATLSVGTLNLAIDTTSADLDNPEATWLYGDS
jgi:hypothetical protein